MLNQPDPDIDDDDIANPVNATDGDASSPPLRQNADRVLATLALDAALSRKSRALLKRGPSIVIVKVPTAEWAEILLPPLRSLNDRLITITATERIKKGNLRIGGNELAHLQHNRSIVYVSADPDHVLDRTVLAAADLAMTIQPVTPALLRKLIRGVTGGVARGVTADMTALDLTVITSVVRPELSAGACVANLRRAVARRLEPVSSSVPLLTALPLTDTVRAWADQTLADLAAVRTGTLTPDHLVYAMLEGPPGTGKTLIAESLARTAGWSFVPSSVGTWFSSGDGALGGVAQNLKSFIDQTLAGEPAIGFMDELDALPDRATLDNRAREWWTTVITLFLTEIDRVRKSGRKVLLIGATNYYNRLDAALVRPGRLQQRVSVLPAQNEAEVIAVLRYYLGADLADADLGKPGRLGRGATPATIEGWIKDARAKARAGDRPLTPTDILAQMVPKDGRTPADIRTIALHEAGHAAVAHRLGRVVSSVSIIPEGEAGGVTHTRLSTIVPTWADLCDTVTVTLGGRAADIVLGFGANAGAEADLADATETIRDAHDLHGLRDGLASIPTLGVRSAVTLAAVNAELERLLARAVAIIEADRPLVLALAERLIADRLLHGDDVAGILGPPPTTLAPRQPRVPRDKTHAEPKQRLPMAGPDRLVTPGPSPALVRHIRRHRQAFLACEKLAPLGDPVDPRFSVEHIADLDRWQAREVRRRLELLTHPVRTLPDLWTKAGYLLVYPGSAFLISGMDDLRFFLEAMIPNGNGRPHRPGDQPCRS